MSGVKYYQGKSSKRGERPSTTRTILHVEPLSTVFVILVTLDALIRMPFYALLYAIPSMRPLSSWSWNRSMLIAFIKERGRTRSSGKYSARIDFSGDQVKTFVATSEATPVWIPKLDKPLTGELGEMMAQTGDESTRISAWWYGKVDKEHKGDGKVVLYYHGGGYIEYFATPVSPTVTPLKMLLASNASLGSGGDAVPLKGLAVEYRLSHIASLPGIIADAVASWRYLIEDCGYSPDDIVVAGDSAGGHLALALTRYLINEKPFGDGIPKGLVLYSPWIDLSLSYVWAGAGQRYESYDYLRTSMMQIAVSEVLRGLDPKAALSLYASSVSLARSITGKEFEGFPPAIINSGELEKFRDEHEAFARHYSDAGSPLEVYVDKDVCHDVYALPFTFDATHKSAAERSTRWLLKLWS